MIRPSFDFSAVAVTKEEHLSWIQEDLQRYMLPTAVIRPDTSRPTSPVQVMRGITDEIGKDINSQPGVERVVENVFDDATIGTSGASTARLRRESQYNPTVAASRKKLPLNSDQKQPSNWEFEIEYDGASTATSSVYRPVQRPADYRK